jgi:uncharacterized protein (TIGR03084 family)
MVTTLEEVMQDLRDETANLDAVLAPLAGDDWFKPTPAEGWDIRDTIGHLASTDDIMWEGITGTPNPSRRFPEQAATIDDFTALHVEEARGMEPSDVYAWWRSATARLHDTIGGFDEKTKYPWGGNMLSPLSLASARIMETWAHSHDVHDALGKDYPDNDRIRHIAHLGLRALPNAFALAGIAAPGPVRLELTSPSGETWTMGPDDAPTLLRGSAGDWTRIVTYRDRDRSCAKRMRGEGPDASQAIEHARAFL